MSYQEEDVEKQPTGLEQASNDGSGNAMNNVKLRLATLVEAGAVLITKASRSVNRPLKNSRKFKILVMLITAYAAITVIVYALLDWKQPLIGQIADIFNGDHTEGDGARSGAPSAHSGDSNSNSNSNNSNNNNLGASGQNSSLIEGSSRLEDGSFDPEAVVDRLLQHPQDESFEFNWEDWLDLAITDSPAIYDKFDKWKSLETLPFPPRERLPQASLAALGKMYIKNRLPNPNRIVLLGKKPGVYHVKYDEEKQHYDFGQKEMTEVPELDNSTYSLESLAADPIGKPLLDVLDKGTPEERVAVDLPKSLFKFDGEAISKLDDKTNPTDLKHAHMVGKALKEVAGSPKHFNECPIKDDPAGHGTHYDWRFFNTIRPAKEHEAFMHHMIRAWSNFVEQEGLMSWIAHGSLMGWWWNGLAMPWDSDNDVQMPIMEFDRFAKYYNGTLVVEDPAEGTGRYYIDISPWYVDRGRGNGRNVIDGRFIDIRSGIYIDITGLAFTAERPDQPGCKNRHFYKMNWLSPARKTLYEGVRSYIPNAFETVLQDEYHKFKSAFYKQFMFKRALSLWVPKDKCIDFDETDRFFDEDNQMTLYGACNNEDILSEFEKTRAVTAAHMDEMELYSGLDLNEVDGAVVFVDTTRSRQRGAQAISGYYPPLRYDPPFEPVK